jgi:tRNA nucleotidyltransferase (CCA-adding enzyme)
MPDYIFLLESRLSPESRAVLERVQELARAQDVNVYLTGGAVRDLISGQPIRDLDFTLEGNPARMVGELEKGGARVALENERLRHYEVVFAGEVDGSVSAARDEYYERPGTKPEHRFSSIMEDLRRRDFSINAIAISLNVQSRGLLLDPTNGLADIEKQEVRALSIHSFTNQPIRLMRILRYTARMGFRMESRTQEWFDLAIERGLHENLEGPVVGDEVRSLAREDNPAGVLKQWDARGFLAAIHPQLQRRKPDYDSLNKLSRIRGNLYAAGLRPKLALPVLYYTFGRLKPREAASALRNVGFRSSEIEAINELVPKAQAIVKTLKGRKMQSPKEAYVYISSLPVEMLAFIELETPNPAAMSKIRAYVQKWRPMRQALPAGELDALGIPRGPKFDKVLEDLFELQLKGRARDPESRVKILRKLAGIKEEKKKPEKEKKKRKEKDVDAKSAEKREEPETYAHHKPVEGAHAGAKAAAHSIPHADAGHAASSKGHAKESGRAEHSHPRKHAAGHGASKPKARAKKARH